MTVKLIKTLNQIAAFLKVPLGNITLDDFSIPTRVQNNSTVSGCLNIILQLIHEANSDVGGLSALEKAQIFQWLEYGLVYVIHNKQLIGPGQILKELNSVLVTKTYLVTHRLTVADVFLYYLLQNTMQNLTNLEKEKYLNVSRWFDNIQQNSTIRQSNSLVDFSTLYLASIVPARH